MSVFGVSTNRTLTLLSYKSYKSIHCTRGTEVNKIQWRWKPEWGGVTMTFFKKNLKISLCWWVYCSCHRFLLPLLKLLKATSPDILWRAVERHSGKCRNSNKSGNSQGKLRTIKRQHLMRTWWIFSLKLFQSRLFYCSQQNNKLFFFSSFHYFMN